MSILKGILHHWNKTTSAYDTIHPETESAYITDWNEGIGKTLASTALGTLVSTLTSDSLFATLLKKAMTALGVKYLVAQNGYVCLGDIFGGIIIQWGKTGTNYEYITFPIAFSSTDNVQMLVTPYHSDGATHPAGGWSIAITSTSTAHCSLTGYDLRFIAIGY